MVTDSKFLLDSEWVKHNCSEGIYHKALRTMMLYDNYDALCSIITIIHHI